MLPRMSVRRDLKRNSTTARNSLQKVKLAGAIEFSGGPALIKDPGGQSELYVEHLTVAVWIYPFEISDIAIGNGHVYGEHLLRQIGDKRR